MKIFEIINEGFVDSEDDWSDLGDAANADMEQLETDLDDSAEKILIGAVKDLIKDEASEIETGLMKILFFLLSYLGRK